MVHFIKCLWYVDSTHIHSTAERNVMINSTPHWVNCLRTATVFLEPKLVLASNKVVTISIQHTVFEYLFLQCCLKLCRPTKFYQNWMGFVGDVTDILVHFYSESQCRLLCGNHNYVFYCVYCTEKPRVFISHSWLHSGITSPCREW